MSHPLAVPLLVGGFSLTSHADVTVTFTEEPNGVTADYIGSVGFSATNFLQFGRSQVTPNLGNGVAGVFYTFGLDSLQGVSGGDGNNIGFKINAPFGIFPSFGTRPGSFSPSSVSGDPFGFDSIIRVDPSYRAGEILSGSASFAAHSFDSMGLVGGTSFSATTGEGDTVTVVIAESVSPIPEVTGSSVLLGLIGLSLFGRRRQR